MSTLITLGAMGISQSAEDYSTWTHSTDLILDTSPTGANVTGTVTGFPILLRLTRSNFLFNQAHDSGRDFRVANASGKPLPYQIERWDSVNGEAEIWIRADSVLGNTAGQKLSVFWGKATAGDSSNGKAVFNKGFSQVWHLGETGKEPRVNSVAGGLPATTMQYDGDESTRGIIGKADSLDGDSLGDYLNLGEGYTEFGQGFTFSVWMYPTAVKKYSQILHLGNGVFTNNILVNRLDTLNDLTFNNYKGTVPGEIKMPNAWALNQWRYITVTVSGTQVKIYRDGVLDSTKTLPNPIDSVHRTMNYLGKSVWIADAYYQGKLDEPRLSKVARGDAWIKLCYQNQKTNQSLVTLKPTTRCMAKFSATKDTTLNEGSALILTGIADCATSLSWSIVSGPAPRIMDPEVKSLSINLPRVAGDTVLVYRFMAVYPESTAQKNVRVMVKEFIPEPIFSLPSGLAWNGKDTLSLQPTISNLKAIQSSRDSILHWSWTVTGIAAANGIPADTAWITNKLVLTSAPTGNLIIGLCLHNNGQPACKTTPILVSTTTSITAGAQKKMRVSKARGPDALGRRFILSKSPQTQLP